MRPRALVVCTLAVLLTLAGAQPATAAGTMPASALSGGVVLDGFGGLHPFGGATLDTAGAPHWNGWDIARSLALLPGGAGGWELDGFGGVHPFGAAAPLDGTPYWSGWNIARALVVNPDARSGYVLDAFGGLHPFGGAPDLSGSPYWSGWAIARGLDIHYDMAGNPNGGWVLDAFGGVHAFGLAPAISNSHYYGGFSFWQALHVTGQGAGAYLVGSWGIVDQAGSPAGVQWSGYPSWGAWDIARDAVPVDPTGGWINPPVDRAGAGALVGALNNWDRARRGLRTLAVGSTLIGIAGAGAGFNLGGCGGSGAIADRSQDMFDRNYFSHTIPGCSRTDYVWQTYYSQYRVRYSYAGENIGYITLGDLPDAAWNINNAWLNSPDHLANIVSGHYSSLGCGGFTGSGYQGQGGQVWVWTCDFTG